MPDEHVILASGPTHDVRLVLQHACLEAAHIPCYLHQETTGMRRGEEPRALLVLVNREDYEKAQELLENLALEAAAKTHGGHWTCEKCSEVIEATFSACWKCDTPRPNW